VTPIRDRIAALVTARLGDEIPDVPVEQARRAIVDNDEFPRLVVLAGNVTASDTAGFGETTYVIGVIVVGYASADPDAENQDLSCQQALSALHARVVRALAAWQPDGIDLNEVRESGTAEFIAYDLDDSSEAAGEFTASFDAESIRPTGHPYAAA
jgi:hypothetical protein